MSILLSSLPSIVGAIVLLAVTFAIIRGSPNSNALVLVGVFGLVLTGATFFQSFVFGADGIDVKFRGIAEDIAEISKKNTAAIQRLTQGVEDVRAQLALVQTASTSLGSGGREQGDAVIFPNDTPWGSLLSPDYCDANPSLCRGVRREGDAISIPKTTLDEVPSLQNQVEKNLSETQKLIEESGVLSARVQNRLEAM